MTADAVLATLTARDIALFLDAGRLRYSAPPGALTDADREAIAEHRQEIVAALLAGAEPGPAPTDPDPAAHCPACGSPSFWRSPASPTWRCAYCSPRDRSRAEAVEALTLAGGQWAPDRAPPIPAPVTVDDLLATHGETVAGCRTLDVLEQADDTDLPELHDRVLLEGFAVALVADHRVRPLPDANLPPLERLAQEIGDDPAELRRWLDGSAQGRRIRQRLEREAGAVDRCLLALRADPAGGLLPVLARALDGAARSRT